ncbi:elongation factor P 5-aminopentanone reductase [Virgibacillus kekensis]|uniref:Elongation factor P 5-aminopentanone reductase n=1 Tax=Virgibacillus kekensis TaxID=202261 RepID=A0ABV9DH48_9BACI
MGKNILIIGASGDIGAAIARSLAEQGYQLLLHYNQNRSAIAEYAAGLPEETVLSVMQADLSSESGVRHLLSKIAFPVDAIIFAGGRAYFSLFQDTSEGVMNEMLNLHVKAPWLITKELLPSMLQKKQGKIIFITSIWGETGASNEVVYSSVKGAQNSFVKALAKEVAPSGVSVNAVSPGFIDTKMNHHLNPEEVIRITDEIPANRAGKAEEVANMVNFLISDKASYIQGEVINVTGGWS